MYYEAFFTTKMSWTKRNLFNRINMRFLMFLAYTLSSFIFCSKAKDESDNVFKILDKSKVLSITNERIRNQIMNVSKILGVSIKADNLSIGGVKRLILKKTHDEMDIVNIACDILQWFQNSIKQNKISINENLTAELQRTVDASNTIIPLKTKTLIFLEKIKQSRVLEKRRIMKSCEKIDEALCGLKGKEKKYTDCVNKEQIAKEKYFFIVLDAVNETLAVIFLNISNEYLNQEKKEKIITKELEKISVVLKIYCKKAMILDGESGIFLENESKTLMNSLNILLHSEIEPRPNIPKASEKLSELIELIKMKNTENVDSFNALYNILKEGKTEQITQEIEWKIRLIYFQQKNNLTIYTRSIIETIDKIIGKGDEEITDYIIKEIAKIKTLEDAMSDVTIDKTENSFEQTDLDEPEKALFTLLKNIIYESREKSQSHEYILNLSNKVKQTIEIFMTEVIKCYVIKTHLNIRTEVCVINDAMKKTLVDIILQNLKKLKFKHVNEMVNDAVNQINFSENQILEILKQKTEELAALRLKLKYLTNNRT